MQNKKADDKDLSNILKDLKKGKESAIGSFLYKGYRIQISRYRQTTAERVSQLYHRRRSSGQCILCGRKVKKMNPKTKALYRLCDNHRNKIDLKKKR